VLELLEEMGDFREGNQAGHAIHSLCSTLVKQL